MLLTGVVHPKHISMMADLLDARSHVAGYRYGSPERARLAAEIMSLFTDGATTADELTAALDARLRDHDE